MASGVVILKNHYYDSVFLMGVNKRISEMPGVEQSAVLMGTEANKKLLMDMGISAAEVEGARPNDLILSVTAGSSQIVEEVIDCFDGILKDMSPGREFSGVRTFQTAHERKPNANLAVFSIPGEFVSHEARKALEAGLNLFLFSSNVPTEEELELKRMGHSSRLLVMGPDCGTSIINGVGIGFANVIRRGNIGALGPSGTGLQEFTSFIHNAGAGISHAIGTGSNDLSDTIGGLTTFTALELLEEDPSTEVMAIVSKPPGEQTLNALLERGSKLKKPLIGCFLGIKDTAISVEGSIKLAGTIDGAANLALVAAGYKPRMETVSEHADEEGKLEAIRAGWTDGSTALRGVFAGGTFCYQSQQILLEAGIPVYSNSPIQAEYRLTDPNISLKHTVVDMGDEYFTLGKPHPMIDSTERAKRILVEAADPSVSILLLDFILGYNAASDPVGDLRDAILEAKALERRAGGELTIVASICGTREDPQDLALQAEMLQEIGVFVFSTNLQATEFCVQLLSGGGE